MISIIVLKLVYYAGRFPLFASARCDRPPVFWACFRQAVTFARQAATLSGQAAKNQDRGKRAEIKGRNADKTQAGLYTFRAYTGCIQPAEIGLFGAYTGYALHLRFAVYTGCIQAARSQKSPAGQAGLLYTGGLYTG